METHKQEYPVNPAVKAVEDIKIKLQQKQLIEDNEMLRLRIDKMIELLLQPSK